MVNGSIFHESGEEVQFCAKKATLHQQLGAKVEKLRLGTKKYTYIFWYFLSSSWLTEGLVSLRAHKRSSILTISSSFGSS